MTAQPQKNQSSKYKNWILFGHFLFWLVFATLMLIVFKGFLGSFLYALVPTTINLVGLMILIYIHLWYLLPRFFDKKRYVEYGVLLIIILLLTSLFRFFVGWEFTKILKWDLEEVFIPDYFVGMLFLNRKKVIWMY